MVGRFSYIALVIFFTLTIAAPIAHANGTAIPDTTITVDSIGDTSHSGDTSSLSWSHTASAGSYLIAGVVIDNGDGTAPTVSTFTYGGTSLTKIGSQLSQSGHLRVEIWQLPNPASGTHTITATFSGVASTVGAFGGSGTFFGVSGVRGFTGEQSLTALIGIGPSEVGDLLIDGVGAVTSSLTPVAGQTLLAGTSTPLDSIVSAGTSGKGAGSGFQMSWDGGAGGVSDPAILIVSLIPGATTVVPEYPWGLPVLAILMLLSYGLVKRRVQTKQKR